MQAIIKSGEKICLLHRSQGNPAIVGKYELPGGTLGQGEQPEDALVRHIQNSAGLTARIIELSDVISMVSREEGDIQHVLVSYVISGLSEGELVTLGRSYDSYKWITLTEIHQYKLRESAQLLLEIFNGAKSPRDNAKDVVKFNVDVTTLAHDAIIYSDGGSRGNPGQSAAAFVIMDNSQRVLDSGGDYLGITTNNQAEYHGVRLGLERAAQMGLRTLELRIDSMLVVNQMKGVYKIKNRELWPINERIRALVGEFEKVTFTHVPRELNQFADTLVNKLLDEHQNDPDVI